MSDLSTGPVGGPIFLEETQGFDGEKKSADDVTEAEDELEDDLHANDDIAGD